MSAALSGVHVARAALLLVARKPAKPSAAKPMSIMAQVPGSGVAAAPILTVKLSAVGPLPQA
jgi:hypothetical protein